MNTTWKTAATPTVSISGLADSLKGDSGAVGKSLAKLGGLGEGMGTGRGGRTGMLFGKKITAKKLGVILDVSGSAWPFLPDALEEIQKAFDDALLVLYPGCGLHPAKDNMRHAIRLYSSIPNKEMEAEYDKATTLYYLQGALKVPEFKKLTKRAAFRNTLFVSWSGILGADGRVAAEPNGMGGKMQSSFEFLLEHGCDNIYWFGDYADGFSPQAIEELKALLAPREIKLHLHNFAVGKPIDAGISQLATETGGTITLTPAGKK